MGIFHGSRSFFMKQRCQWRMLFFWDVKPCGLVDICQCFCRNMLPCLQLHPQPSMYPYLAGASSSWHFSESIKDCMLQIPEYSNLHSYHHEDLKTHTRCASIRELCNGVKNCSRLLWKGLTFIEFLQNWFLHHSSAFLVTLLCLLMNVWQMWHDLCHL